MWGRGGGGNIDVLTAKLMDVRQRGTAYVNEIENLTKFLQGPLDNTEKYSMHAAVRSINADVESDKVRTIIQAGQFFNMSELIFELINVCTDVYVEIALEDAEEGTAVMEIIRGVTTTTRVVIGLITGVNLNLYSYISTRANFNAEKLTL